MKIKILALAALLTISGYAAAQSVTVGYANRTLDAGGHENVTGLSVKTASYRALVGDVGVSATQNASTNVLTTRSEIGVTYGLGLPLGLKGEARLATGWKAKSGSAATTYYVVEPSVTAKVGSTPLSVKLGYRLREAYDNSVADTSRTTRLSVGYDLTTKDKVSLGRDWQNGVGAGIQTSLQYTRAF
jgi:hypothetical protein